MQAHEFDEWRRNYYEMSFQEHAEFYRRLHEDHPDQRHFSLESALGFFTQIKGRAKVAELGGYDGSLAAICLETFPDISRWNNYDICPPPGQNEDDRYSVWPLSCQYWCDNGGFDDSDAFVASHVIEHLSERDLADLMGFLEGVPYLYLDAPLQAKGFTDWTGSTAAHKLTFSWEAVDALVCSYGYERFEVPGPAHCYRRPG